MYKLCLSIFSIIFSVPILIGQCDADRHSALLVDNWMSCDMTENPNLERGTSHWIMYDFGDTYALNASTIWNCNSFGNIDAGISTYVVDYSNDGINWIEFGQFDLAQANASSFYEGEAGPDFESLAAQYILITSLGTYGSSCACLSEIRFETSGLTTDVVEVNNLQLSLTLAPNPASELVTLQIEDVENSFDAEISVLDQTGRLISKLERNISKGSSQVELSTVDLQSGNYIVKIQSAEGIATRKLIIIQDHK